MIDPKIKLVSDESRVTGKHFGVPARYKNPRTYAYLDGHMQPAIIVYKRQREVYRWIQRPRWWNLGGAAFRPDVKTVLKALGKA